MPLSLKIFTIIMVLISPFFIQVGFSFLVTVFTKGFWSLGDGIWLVIFAGPLYLLWFTSFISCIVANVSYYRGKSSVQN